MLQIALQWIWSHLNELMNNFVSDCNVQNLDNSTLETMKH